VAPRQGGLPEGKSQHSRLWAALPAQNEKTFRACKFSPSDSALISEGCKKYTDRRIRSMWVQIKMIFDQLLKSGCPH
jgi:hypothetical protein